MKKADLKRFAAALDKALDPPRRQDKKALDSLLADYEEAQSATAAPTSDVATTLSVAPTPPVAPTPSPELLLQETAPTPDVEAPPNVDPARFTRVPNDIFDKVLPTLKQIEQLVLLRLYRLSRGFNKERCTVSIGKLAKQCNAGTTATRNATFALEIRGLVRRVNVDHSNPEQLSRGVEFEVLLPAAATASSVGATRGVAPTLDAAPTRGVAIKERFKQNIIKEEIEVTEEEKETYKAIHGREWEGK